MATNYDGGTPTTIHVHLTRPVSSDAPTDASAWGFRLFSTNTGLGVHQVQRGTLADICGLLANDEVIRINGRDTVGMSLEDARLAIAQAGNDVELVVQRGPTRIWQPQVTYNTGSQHVLTGAHDTSRNTSRRQHHAAVGNNNYRSTPTAQQYHAPYTAAPVSYSLAMPPKPDMRLVTMFNSPPKPFYLSIPGATAATTTLDRRLHRGGHHHHHQAAAAQPMHQSAYEPTHRLSYPGIDDEPVYDTQFGHHQDEVRSNSTGGGSRRGQMRAPYASSNDAEFEDEPRRQPPKNGSWLRQGVPVLPNFPPPPPPPPLPPPMPSHHQRSLSSGRAPRGPAVNAMAGLVGSGGGGIESSSSEPPRCMACTGFVTGVFAKIRGRPIHPECFRCTTCGTSLKNRGHFWVNERLYCEVHARQMDTRSNVLY